MFWQIFTKYLVVVCLFSASLVFLAARFPEPMLEMDDPRLFELGELPEFGPPKFPEQKSGKRFNSSFVSTPAGLGNDGIRAIMWLSDHKLLAAGYAHNGNFNDFVLARYWPDGSLDTTFDADGLVITSFIEGDGIAHAVTTDGAGRYVVAGRRWGFSDFDFGVARYNTDGSLDSTFAFGGGVGFAKYDLGGNDFGRGIGVDSNQRIVVTGYTDQGTLGDFDMAVIRLMSDGSYDTSFSADGILIADFPSGNADAAYSMLLDSGNRVYAAGFSNDGVDNDFGIIRVNSNGVLDTAFSGDGFQTLDSPGPGTPADSDDVIWGLAFDDIDRILATGRANNGVSYNFGIARLTTDGGVASTSYTFDSGGVGRAVSMAGNFILMGGRTFDGNDWNTGAIRISTTGVLDANFDTDGRATIAVSGNHDVGLAMAYNAGRMILGGHNNNGTNLDFVIVRYNSDGSTAASGDLDANFDVDGFNISDFAGDVDIATHAFRDNQGNFLVTGHRENGGNATRNFAIARYLSSGALDSNFSGDGLQDTDFAGDRDQSLESTVDNNDRIILVGYRENGNGATRNMGIARYLSNGTLDSNFSGDGLQDIDFSGDQDHGRAVLVNASNEVIVGGLAENGNADTRDFALIRLLSNGNLDTSFGTAGRTTTDFDGQRDQIEGMAFDSAGGIIAVGSRENGAAATRDFAIARYFTNGNLDTAFGTAGLVRTDFAGGQDEAFGIVRDNQGRFLVAGRAGNDFGIARYLTDGSLDTSFSGDGLLTVDNGGSTDLGRAISIQNNGKIVVVGASANDVMVVRVLTNGTLDSSFGGDGIVLVNPGGTDDGRGVAILEDDRMMIGGDSDNDFVALQIWP